MEVSVSEESKPSADPTLLGVAVPVTVTVDAAKQVAVAWETCFKELFSAIKTKAASARPQAPSAEAPPAEVHA